MLLFLPSDVQVSRAKNKELKTQYQWWLEVRTVVIVTERIMDESIELKRCITTDRRWNQQVRSRVGRRMKQLWNDVIIIIIIIIIIISLPAQSRKRENWS